MLTLATLRITRQVFKGTAGFGKVSGLLDKENHPRVHRVYFCAAIVVYISHITVSLSHGVELEGSITALAGVVELVAHICGV